MSGQHRWDADEEEVDELLAQIADESNVKLDLDNHLFSRPARRSSPSPHITREDRNLLGDDLANRWARVRGFDRTPEAPTPPDAFTEEDLENRLAKLKSRDHPSISEKERRPSVAGKEHPSASGKDRVGPYSREPPLEDVYSSSDRMNGASPAPDSGPAPLSMEGVLLEDFEVRLAKLKGRPEPRGRTPFSQSQPANDYGDNEKDEPEVRSPRTKHTSMPGSVYRTSGRRDAAGWGPPPRDVSPVGLPESDDDDEPGAGSLLSSRRDALLSSRRDEVRMVTPQGRRQGTRGDFVMRRPSMGMPAGSIIGDSSRRPSRSPEPDSRRRPSLSPEPDSRRRPSLSPEPDSRRRPSLTPEPDSRRRPSLSPEPDSRRRPSLSPEPDSRRRPSLNPEPDSRRRPSLSPGPESRRQPPRSPEPDSRRRPSLSPGPDSRRQPSHTPELDDSRGRPRSPRLDGSRGPPRSPGPDNSRPPPPLGAPLGSPRAPVVGGPSSVAAAPARGLMGPAAQAPKRVPVGDLAALPGETDDTESIHAVLSSVREQLQMANRMRREARTGKDADEQGLEAQADIVVAWALKNMDKGADAPGPRTDGVGGKGAGARASRQESGDGGDSNAGKKPHKPKRFGGLFGKGH